MNLKSTLILFIGAAFILSGCNIPAQAAANPSAEDLSTTPTIDVTLTSQEIEPTSTPEPIMTPTPDTRIPPDQWQSWPIIPETTNRAKEIYLQGIIEGVNPYAFSKIGDCQNVKESFMGIYDTKRYFLQDWQVAWQETIDQFVGYFDRDSHAFGQGLNVAAALSPLHADPSVCQPAESPVQCELRVINPAFAFVRFERWYPEETPPDLYEKYLRQILDEIIAHGTVPLLMTKADNVEGGHQINAIIAKVAYDYDLPLYNWWRAAQALPNNGIDPERDDKFHIDPIYAWTEQSVYGLGTLDSIWKGTSQQ
ncbi:MAG: hypothetical protein FJZ98_02510 [Chloroflexi bacterium]|nr:hypothetical protein [Chloroflexota bacterium]